MKEKLLQVQILINGEKAEDFKENGLGKYLSGDVTYTFAEKAYTMTFHEGTMIAITEGVKLTGIDMGVTGSNEGWQELYMHKNFSRAIAPKHGKLSLQGNMVRCMGNLNCLGYISRILCEVV